MKTPTVEPRSAIPRPTVSNSTRLPRARRGRFRRAVEFIAGLAIAALLADRFLIDGWLVPSVVSSGSMAPALLGPHCRSTCQACGMPLVCDAQDLTVDSLVCPNCGWPGNPLEPGIVAGDRLLIDRSTLGIRPARRWEVIVFHCPSHASDLCVKRIVGLPGETLEVRDGDIYIDGKIARKTLAEQQALAQLIHDSKYRDPHLPPRWRSDATGSKWRLDERGNWLHPQSDAPSPAVDWLTYVHCRRVGGSPDSVEETPILDDDPYNPGTSRRLNDVRDFLLAARVRLAGNGALFLRANDGRETFQVEIETSSGRLSLQRDSHDVPIAQADALAGQLPAAASVAGAHEIILSTFDRRLLLAIDGRTELTYDYEPNAVAMRPISRPVAIGIAGPEIEIDRLQVFRDVYYTPPNRPVGSVARRLGPDEYFVLGDNSPISVDSRSWMGGETVPRRLFVGRLLEPRRRPF